MKTKDLNKEQTIQLIDTLKKRIDFNNKLNAFVRKFRKQYGVVYPHQEGAIKFNGYWDEPTPEMKKAMDDILDNATLCDMSWMSEKLKANYRGSTGAIFGQVYSPAVNTYVLNDLHDCEKHLETLEQAEAKNDAETEESGWFKVERDLENNRLNLYFDYKPEEEERKVLKSNGFKWSPYLGAWTRQLTANAEYSLKKVVAEIDKLNYNYKQ